MFTRSAGQGPVTVSVIKCRGASRKRLILSFHPIVMSGRRGWTGALAIYERHQQQLIHVIDTVIFDKRQDPPTNIYGTWLIRK